MTTLDGFFMAVLAEGEPKLDVPRAAQLPVLGGRLFFSKDPEHATVSDIAAELGLRTMLIEPSLRDTTPELPVKRLPGQGSPEDVDKEAAENPAMDLLAYYLAPQGVTRAVYALERSQTGVFLTTGGIEILARHLEQHGHSTAVALAGAAHALYLHEMFHHIVAAGSAILVTQGSGRAYLSYRAEADAELGYNPLEEQVANAFMLRHVDPALRPALEHFVERQARGYRDGVDLDGVEAFNDACIRLVRQLLSGPVSDGEAALYALNLDLSQRLVTPDTARLHVVESPNSAHQFGDWRFVG